MVNRTRVEGGGYIKHDIVHNTRFPSGKKLGEWRKNETKSIQRETNTTTPEIEE